MRQLSQRLALIGLLLGLGAAQPGRLHAAPAPSDSAATRQLLDQWLAALGGRAAVESVRATYVWSRFHAGSAEGRSEEWNTARGEFRSIAQNILGKASLAMDSK